MNQHLQKVDILSFPFLETLKKIILIHTKYELRVGIDPTQKPMLVSSRSQPLAYSHWSFQQQGSTLYVWSILSVSSLYKKLCSNCSDSLRQPEPQPHILEQKCVLLLDNLQMIRLSVGYIIIIKPLFFFFNFILFLIKPLLMKGSQATLTRL